MTDSAVISKAPATLAEAKSRSSSIAIQSASRGGSLPMPADMGQALEFAHLMSRAGPMVGKAFRDEPGACLAILTQAMRWGMDPFAVSSKAYLVNEQIAYEAQLVTAVIASSSLIVGRLVPVFENEGDQRVVVITGRTTDSDLDLVYTSPPLHKVRQGKKSPLWQADPDQQLFYYASRAWARRYVPDLLMGVYTQDELEAAPVRHVQSAEAPLSLQQMNERALRSKGGVETDGDHVGTNDSAPAAEEEHVPTAVHSPTATDAGDDDAPIASSPALDQAPVEQEVLTLAPDVPRIDWANASEKEARLFVGAIAANIAQLSTLDDVQSFWLSHSEGLDACANAYPEHFEGASASYDARCERLKEERP